MFCHFVFFLVVFAGGEVGRAVGISVVVFMWLISVIVRKTCLAFYSCGKLACCLLL